MNQTLITRAAISLHAVEKNARVRMSLVARRRKAAEIARGFGQVIPCPGSEGNLNPTVEAIIAATDTLAAEGVPS